jgi:fatty acid desaturase
MNAESRATQKLDEARQRLSAGLEHEIGTLRRLSALRRTVEIGFFAALWAMSAAITMALMDVSGPTAWMLRLAAMGTSALALNAFYLLSHEAHHHLLFRRRSINHALNVLLCIPLLHSPSAYRVLHQLHHRFLGGPGDPDEYRNYTGSARLRWVLQWVRLTIGTLVYMPMIPIVAWRRATSSERPFIAIEYAGMAAIWAVAFAVVPLGVLLQVWLIPGIAVGYISGVRALAQHALTDGRDPLLASRTVRSNRAVAFFLLNENYHLEHHLFPEIPSYNLPRLHALLRDRLPYSVDAVSYSGFLAGFVRRTFRGDESPMGLHIFGDTQP